MIHTDDNNMIKVKDFRVSYIDTGFRDGPVIVFIHGFPLNKSMWRGQIDALKSHYRVITYDVRGHGNSELGYEEFTVKRFAGDLIDLLDVLGIDQAGLCGLSMGGYIALNAIVSHPDRFNTLVLCDTNCIADTPGVTQKRMETIEVIRQYGVEQFADDNLHNLFAPESFTRKKQEVAAVKEMMIRSSEDSIVRTQYALAGREETCSKLHDIKLPVLIMVGEKDTITPPLLAKDMHDKINGSVFKVIENAGHLSNIENPDQFNMNLLRFLKDVYG